MVILVTGGCGYIGSRLMRDLASNRKFGGSTVRVIDNMMRERYVAIMDLSPDGRFEFIEGDIRKDDDLKRAFQDVDMVVDLAGITNAPLSFERKDLTFDVNVNRADSAWHERRNLQCYRGERLPQSDYHGH